MAYLFSLFIRSASVYQRSFTFIAIYLQQIHHQSLKKAMVYSKEHKGYLTFVTVDINGITRANYVGKKVFPAKSTLNIAIEVENIKV